MSLNSQPDPWRIWNDLKRTEDSLKRAGIWTPTARAVYDSMGRPIGTGPRFSDWAAQLSRVQRVRDALRQSGPQAQKMVARSLAGIELSTIWDILISTCEDIALYYGGAVLVGTAFGAVGGAFFGGVGALPGAGLGAVAGAEAGAWLLAFLGLKALVEGLLTVIPDALRCYRQGFLEAWGPTHHDRRDPLQLHGLRGDVSRAASLIADGHVLMIGAILTALVAYLTRGRGGDKAAVLTEIRQSPRLGPKVADWLVLNEGKLVNHPQLQPRKHWGALPEEPAGAPKSAKPREREAPARKAMAQKRLPCFKAKDLPQGSVPEFDRQLGGQERGINDMTVDEYLKGREAFDGKDVKRDPRLAQEARADFQAKLNEDLADTLVERGMSRSEANVKASEMAAEKMKTLAALHNPDMVVGGKDVIADFGDRNINSRIGGQWKNRLNQQGETRVGELDKAARSVSESDRAHIKMNAKLERCK